VEGGGDVFYARDKIADFEFASFFLKRTLVHCKTQQQKNDVIIIDIAR
jgi:hypothetical protein